MGEKKRGARIKESWSHCSNSDPNQLAAAGIKDALGFFWLFIMGGQSFIASVAWPLSVCRLNLSKQ